MCSSFALHSLWTFHTICEIKKYITLEKTWSTSATKLRLYQMVFCRWYCSNGKMLSLFNHYFCGVEKTHIYTRKLLKLLSTLLSWSGKQNWPRLPKNICDMKINKGGENWFTQHTRKMVTGAAVEQYPLFSLVRYQRINLSPLLLNHTSSAGLSNTSTLPARAAVSFGAASKTHKWKAKQSSRLSCKTYDPQCIFFPLEVPKISYSPLCNICIIFSPKQQCQQAPKPV